MKKENGLHIPGLYPTGINIHTGRFTDTKCRLGAMGDSWFEYLLKQYLLVDGTMPQYSRMCKPLLKNKIDRKINNVEYVFFNFTSLFFYRY